jgi:hypothetical protein
VGGEPPDHRARAATASRSSPVRPDEECHQRGDGTGFVANRDRMDLVRLNVPPFDERLLRISTDRVRGHRARADPHQDDEDQQQCRENQQGLSPGRPMCRTGHRICSGAVGASPTVRVPQPPPLLQSASGHTPNMVAPEPGPCTSRRSHGTNTLCLSAAADGRALTDSGRSFGLWRKRLHLSRQPVRRLLAIELIHAPYAACKIARSF